MLEQFDDKSYINNLLNSNLNVKLAFAEFMPIYTDSKYQNDFQTQQFCVDSITGRILLYFSQEMMKNPFFRTKIRKCIIQVMNEQLKKTPQYIKEELKRLRGRINTFYKMINSFIKKIDIEVIDMKMRFSERSQNLMFNYKQRCMSYLDDHIPIMNYLVNDITLGDSFTKQSITNLILKQSPVRIARLCLPKEVCQQQNNLHSAFPCQIQCKLQIDSEKYCTECSQEVNDEGSIKCNQKTKNVDDFHDLDDSDISDEPNNDPTYPFHSKIPIPQKKLIMHLI